MICIEGLRKTTRLTVCNYELYQDNQQANNKQTTSKQQASNTQVTTTKEKEEHKENKELNTDFVKSEFKQTFERWLNYKRDRKEKYKSQDSVMTCYKNLLKLSGEDPLKASEIVENSIGSNYSGLFPLKTQAPKKLHHDTDY